MSPTPIPIDEMAARKIESRTATEALVGSLVAASASIVTPTA